MMRRPILSSLRDGPADGADRAFDAERAQSVFAFFGGGA